jgi:DNA-directed RNA polymerase subunit RPC12/RpoP
MPKLIKTKIYQCNDCGKHFEIKEDAFSCEEKHLKEREIANKQKVFPVYHEKDSKYSKHCVECGKELLRYESIWDGHRNDTGDISFTLPYKTLMDGKYCLDCYAPLEKTITNAVLKYRKQKENIKCQVN